jgi:hypothetical protein
MTFSKITSVATTVPATLTMPVQYDVARSRQKLAVGLRLIQLRQQQYKRSRAFRFGVGAVLNKVEAH